MTKGQVRIGVRLRVTDRWDVPAGTLSQMDTVGHAGQFGEWCFTVRSSHCPPSGPLRPYIMGTCCNHGHGCRRTALRITVMASRFYNLPVLA
jgi:hypothetical protein